MKNTLLLLLLLLIFTACEKQINGKVINNFNQPVEGVKVSILNSNFETVTDTDGQFEIGYVAGDITVSFKKPDHRSENRHLKITEKENYPLSVVELIKYPSEKGLFLVGKENYVKLNKSDLIKSEKKQKSRYGSTNNYYYKAQVDSLNTFDVHFSIEKDSLTFFDNLPRSVVLSKVNSKDVLLNRVYQRSLFGSDFDLKGIVVDFDSKRIVKGKRFISIKKKNINDSSIYGFSEMKSKTKPLGSAYLFKIK